MKRIATFGLLALLVIILAILPACTCHRVGDRIELDCWGDLIPCENLTYDLGSEAYWWDDAYIDDLHVTSLSGNYTDRVGYTFVVAASNAVDTSRADYICDGTDDDVQINAAITAATVGGRVKLSEGSFSCTANVLLSENITLVGQGMSTILTFTEKVVSNCIVMDGNFAQLGDMQIIVGAGCGAAGSRPNVVYATGRSDLLLENLYLVGDKTVGSDTSANRQNGICFANVDNSLLVNCTGTGNYYSGIRMHNSDYDILRDCTFSNNTYQGIFAEDSHYNTYDSCYCHSNTERGMWLKTSTDAKVNKGIYQSNGKSGIYWQSIDSSSLLEASLLSNTLHGLDTSGDYNRIGLTKAYDNTLDGLHLSTGDYNSFIGNTSESNTDDGLAIEGGVNTNYTVVDGNQLINNTGTDYVDNGNQTEYWGGSTNAYIELRPALDMSSVAAHGKPAIVTIGAYKGFSLPIWNAPANADEELYFEICVPNRWDGESDIDIHIACALGQANDDKNFKLELCWEHLTPGTDIVPATCNNVTAQVATGAGAAPYQTYQPTFVIDYDIDVGDVIVIDDILGARLRRIDATANEIAGNVIIFHMGVIFQRDKVGTPVP